SWTCDCPDFSFRHTECKHIHAVKFSKLLRKQVYQYNTYSYKNHHSRLSCKKFAGRHNKIGDM
ncbi:MAG TPA: SWIM zinc finger family protein, partial [Nitrososphaeraceae archaeon]|nr:SWIM zinc finger family protein [Nitrososphaeraceae archaeon]